MPAYHSPLSEPVAYGRGHSGQMGKAKGGLGPDDCQVSTEKPDLPTVASLWLAFALPCRRCEITAFLRGVLLGNAGH